MSRLLPLLLLLAAACNSPAGAAALASDTTSSDAGFWVDEQHTCHLPLSALPTTAAHTREAAIVEAKTTCQQNSTRVSEHVCPSGVHIIVGAVQAWFFAADGTLLAYHHWSDWLRPECLTGNDLYGTIPECPGWQVHKYPEAGTQLLCTDAADASSSDAAEADVPTPDAADTLDVAETADDVALDDAADGTDATGGVGAKCQDPSDPPCGSGLVCCYPCGIPGCTNKCMTPCAEGPGCTNGCPLLP